MLTREPIKNYLRLTCLTQHSVTLFSILKIFNTLARDQFSKLTDIIHVYLSMLTAKISILFTGLILLFLLYSHLNKGRTKSPLNNKKKAMSFFRIARNIHAHYGTTVILWYLMQNPTIADGEPFDTKNDITGMEWDHLDRMQILFHVNVGISIWGILIYNHFNIIYDVDQLATWKIVFPLAMLSFVADATLALFIS